jgi:hypothetical protein
MFGMSPWQVIKISDFLRSMENAGEIGITLALHTSDGATLSSNKPCCFVLDAPKEKTMQKKAAFAKNIQKQFSN